MYTSLRPRNCWGVGAGPFKAEKLIALLPDLIAVTQQKLNLSSRHRGLTGGQTLGSCFASGIARRHASTRHCASRNDALWRLRQVMQVFIAGLPKLPLAEPYLQACPFGGAAHGSDEITIHFWEWAEADEWPSLPIA